MKALGLMIAIVFLLVAGCSKATPSQNPQWVDQLITKFQGEPVGNPPQSIWRYEYKGQTVYYVPPQCCDQFSTLYDANGNEMCAPDGGFTGRGDGQCPDFVANKRMKSLYGRTPETGIRRRK